MEDFPTTTPKIYPVALHDYLTEVIGSKASIRVLKALVRYRGKVFTMRELAKTAGLSHPEVSTVVKELESRGVVKLQPVGMAYRVTLNEDSYGTQCSHRVRANSLLLPHNLVLSAGMTNH